MYKDGPHAERVKHDVVKSVVHNRKGHLKSLVVFATNIPQLGNEPSERCIYVIQLRIQC